VVPWHSQHTPAVFLAVRRAGVVERRGDRGDARGRFVVRQPRAPARRPAASPFARPRLGHGGGQRTADRRTVTVVLAAAPGHSRAILRNSRRCTERRGRVAPPPGGSGCRPALGFYRYPARLLHRVGWRFGARPRSP